LIFLKESCGKVCNYYVVRISVIIGNQI